ncbi:MFS transporter [Specibacter sp. RAF43]|uniref:MFS transporter n=1 Tax=Specibacter sp. RAF43 TaxID=3233057 RepID=UPI003F9E56CF
MSRHPAVLQKSLIAAVQVLGLAVWFSATAVGATLQREWSIGTGTLVWLTASVQIGFVAGAVASTVLKLSDRFRPERLLAVCAIGAAAATGVLAVSVDSIGPAIALRFLTGVFLAGIYPVGMKLMASWAEPERRGKAFGVLIGALTVGSALPHLISGFGPLPWRQVMGASAVLALVAAVVATAWIRVGPHTGSTSAPVVANYSMTMFRERGPRLANIGYFGHMWELYALWTWLPMYLIMGQQGRGVMQVVETGLTVFITMGLGGVTGTMIGGWAADKWGRPQAAAVALAVSGACCLASPLMFGANGVAMIVFLFVWGAAVIADSGVFSTALSESANRRYLGTALTTQTAIGFLLTVISIQFVPLFAGAVGWQYAFLLLLPGPVIGVLAMKKLASIKSIQPQKAVIDNESTTAVPSP